MIVEPGKTYIGKVRARSSERDTLALQIRLTSTLSATGMQPPGLPAASILCIRKFRDPLPGALHLQRSGMRPPHAWEQAVSAALKQLVEHAVRPAHNPVPADAEAVIFADRAEMLACLASDWCEGNVSARWWWQGLFRGKDIGQLLVPSWLETPEYIPAALQQLAARGKAVPFVQALRDSDVHTMLQSIMRSFGLYELQFVYETATKEPVQTERVQSSGPQSSPSTAKHQHETRERETSAVPQSTRSSTHQNQPVQQSHYRVAPWQSWVPEISSANELAGEQQTLLGIGLMLVRAPTIVRTSSFVHAVLQWWRAEDLLPASDTSYAENHPGIGDAWGQHTQSSAEHLFPASDTSYAENHPGVEDAWGQHTQSTQSSTEDLFPASDTSYAENHPGVGDAWGQHTQSSNASIAERPGKVSELAERESDMRKEFAGISDDKGNADTCHEAIQRPVSESVELVQEAIRISAAEPGDAWLQAAQISPSKPVEASFAVPPFSALDALFPPIKQKQPGTVELIEAQIQTELGGLFYLINLALFLNLYGDFTTPLQPGLSLSIWDFITLLGQQLLGPAAKFDDPIWSFLAQLAGWSEQEPPSKDFTPPDSWRVPAEWLAPFPEEGPWRWNVNNGRLQVQHPAQFLVLDVPLDRDDAEEQLKREMQEFIDLEHAEAQLVKDDVCCDGSAMMQIEEVIRELFAPDGADKSAVGTINRPLRLERWLGWLMPYVRLRLQRALGLTNPEDVACILCEHAARIFLTATHLDIILSLAELPIEVRLSGLDRNPGWVPAAGHFIAFHFE